MEGRVNGRKKKLTAKIGRILNVADMSFYKSVLQSRKKNRLAVIKHEDSHGSIFRKKDIKFKIA